MQREIKTPICLDESIVSLADARHADELGSCRIINIKLGRVGGHTEVRLIQAYAIEHGIGYGVKEDRIETLTVRRETVRLQ